MTLTPEQRAGIATAAVAIIGAIAYGLITPQRSDLLTWDGGSCATHVTVSWRGAVPPDVACEEIEVTGPSEAWSVLGLCQDGRSAVARICAAPSTGEEPALPGGIRKLGEGRGAAYVAGMPEMEVWDVRHASAPLGCACGPRAGGGCLVVEDGGSRAPVPGEHLEPGTWAGDCPRKPCWETERRAEPGESVPEACR